MSEEETDALVKNPSKEEEDSNSEIKEVGIVADQELDVRDCLNSKLSANEVSGDVIRSLVVNIEGLLDPLPEDIAYQIDSLRIKQFFSNTTQEDILAQFPLLKILFTKYMPSKMDEITFWRRFIWYVHLNAWEHHKQDFDIDLIDDALTALSDDIDKEEEGGGGEVIQLDYHSVNRYIASAILAFLKVFIVIAILNSGYIDPYWWYYLYPALWVVIGFLIIGRALQIQTKNNKVKEQLELSLEQGIELKEMESV